MQEVVTSVPRGLTLIHRRVQEKRTFLGIYGGIVVRADFVLFYFLYFCIVLYPPYTIKQTKDYNIDICCKQGNGGETGWLEIRLCPSEATFM